MTETDILKTIRLRLTKYGRYFRNNTGVLKDQNGRPVKFGLAVGSSDLIGWTKTDRGAIFTAIEVKRPGKKPTEKQQNFINTVNENGGIAFVAFSADDAESKLIELI